MTRYEPGVALIVVDMQNDLADPAGALYISGAEGIVNAINTRIARALEADAPVVYTRDWHPRHSPYFSRDGGIWPSHCMAGTWGVELLDALDVRGPIIDKGTDAYVLERVGIAATGAAVSSSAPIAPEACPQCAPVPAHGECEDTCEVYSAFAARDPATGRLAEGRLHEVLNALRVNRTIIAGAAADYCVVETALDSARLGYETTVLAGCTSAVDLNPGDREIAFERMHAAGIEVA